MEDYELGLKLLKLKSVWTSNANLDVDDNGFPYLTYTYKKTKDSPEITVQWRFMCPCGNHRWEKIYTKKNGKVKWG